MHNSLAEFSTVHLQWFCVLQYKSTCRGPKPLAGHYLAGGTGRLTSADGVFKEWVAADWMTTTSIYTEDYSRSDSFIGVSTVTGAFTVKKAGVYFIYAQVKILMHA